MSNKTRNILITIVVLVIFIPLFVDVLLWKRSPITFGNDWQGFFGDYFGSIIGGLVAYMLLQLQRDQGEEVKHDTNRSFVFLEEYYGHYRLKNSGLPPGTKIIQTDDYKKFVEEMRQQNPEELESGRLSFYRVSQKGFGETIFNCNVLLKGKASINESQKQSFQKLFHLSMVSKDESIFIPLVFSQFNVMEPTQVEITYRTMSNEFIIYIYDIENGIETYYKNEENVRNKLMVSPIKSVNWDYPLQEYGGK